MIHLELCAGDGDRAAGRRSCIFRKRPDVDGEERTWFGLVILDA